MSVTLESTIAIPMQPASIRSGLSNVSVGMDSLATALPVQVGNNASVRVFIHHPQLLCIYSMSLHSFNTIYLLRTNFFFNVFIYLVN